MLRRARARSYSGARRSTVDAKTIANDSGASRDIHYTHKG